MRTVLAGVLLVPLLLSGFAQAKNGSEDTWQRLHVAGAHAGSVRTRTRKVDRRGVKCVETTVTTDMTFKRLGESMHVNTVSEHLERLDGTLLRILTVTNTPSGASSCSYAFSKGKVTIETTSMNRVRTVDREVGRDLVGPAFTRRALKTLAGTSGQEVRIKTFMADFQRVVASTTTSFGREAARLHDGTTPMLTRLESVLEGIPGMRPITWLDDKGKPVKTSLAMSGVQFDTYRVASRALALATGETLASAPDLFAQSMLTENDPIPVPRHLEQATIVVRRHDKTIPFPTYTANGLTVSAVKDGRRLIVARRTVPSAAAQGVCPLAPVPEELEDALAASSMIESDSEEIIQAALGVRAGERSAWKTAQKLERWVFENMTEKNLNVLFGSALQAYRTREGDCTEHAVLLAALCRAVGIPARVVMGLEYLLGAWGGHAWNDVWIEGAWYQLDATNGYGFVDPLHLPTVHLVMKEGGASEFAPLLRGEGNLDVDIVSVVRDGRAIPVNDAAKLITIQDGRYRDPIWSIQLDAPDGFVYDPPGAREGMSARLVALDGKTSDGRSVEILIDAVDAPATGGLEAAARMLQMDPEAAVSGSVDGRPSTSVTSTGGAQHITQTLVLADGALFIFTLSCAGGEAERQAFRALLQSVDFDVK